MGKKTLAAAGYLRSGIIARCTRIPVPAECNRRPVDPHLYYGLHCLFRFFFWSCQLDRYQRDIPECGKRQGHVASHTFPVVANFLVGQLTPLMLKSPHWGPAATFWTFAVLCAPGLWLTRKLIPETRGKSLEEITDSWKAKYKKQESLTKATPY